MATFIDVKDGVMHVGITMQGKEVMTQEEASPYNAFDFYPHEKDNGKITDLAVTAPLGEGKETITSTWASVYASQMVFESLAYTTFAKQYTYIDPEHEYSSWKWDATKKKYVQNTSEPASFLAMVMILTRLRWKAVCIFIIVFTTPLRWWPLLNFSTTARWVSTLTNSLKLMSSSTPAALGMTARSDSHRGSA